MRLRTFFFLGAVMALFSSDGVRAQIVPPAGGSICALSGTQTTGYVLTATNGGTGCSWQTVGGTATTIWTGIASPNGSFASVTNGSGHGGNSASISALNTTGATTIVVITAGNSTYGTMSDTLSNTFTTAQSTNGNNLYWRIYYCTTCTVGSSDTFTVTGFPDYAAISVYAFVGGVYDVSNSATYATGATVTPSTARELILGVVGDNANGNAAGAGVPASPFSLITTATSTNAYATGISSYLSLSTAPIGTTWTVPGQTYATGGSIAFKPPASFTSGQSGDFYYATGTNTWYGPRPSGASPTWPVAIGPPTGTGALATHGEAVLDLATGHDISLPRTCVAASASGTAYTCTTSPVFTPATGDQILFKSDVASTGSATLNINSGTAYTIKKLGTSANLIANDLLVGQWNHMVFDGTYWQKTDLPGNGIGSLFPTLNGFIAGGTKFTASGCSNSTLVGGATAGSYDSGTTGTCTVVITTGLTATNGWTCGANDLTTPADVQTQTASSTTTATISGTTVSGDVINFHCIAF